MSLALLVWSVPPAFVAPATAMPPPGPPACRGVTLIGARGSGESLRGFNGLGAAVNQMATVLRAWMAKDGLSMSTVFDPYPADGVGDLAPSGFELLLLPVDPPGAISDWLQNHLDKYLRSIATGVSDAVGLVDDTIASCPHTKIVLAGYSQGAIVMHQAELRLGRGARRHIWGTLLLGDGDRVPHTRAKEFGSSLARAEGVQVYAHGLLHLPGTYRDVPLPESTANICNARDIVCDFNLVQLAHFSESAKVHTSYVVKTAHGTRYSPLLAQAAGWLGRRIIFHRR